MSRFNLAQDERAEMQKKTRDQWMRDVEMSQRNIMFPDTPHERDKVLVQHLIWEASFDTGS